MKKLFTTLLTLVFVLSLGAVAFASTGPDLEDFTLKDAKIPKSFEPINQGKLSGEQTFTFTFTQNTPPLENPTENLTTVGIPNTTITYPAGEYGNKTGDINLEAFDDAPVGRYTYLVQETVPSPKTAGMVYTGRTGTLFVDKESDIDGTVKSYLIIGTVGTDKYMKFMNFDNKFGAGDLTIEKLVTGNLGDRTKEFAFTVNLTAPDDPGTADPVVKKTVVNGVMELYKNGAPTVPVTYVTFDDGSATVMFNLKHGQTFTIKNLPYGVTYDVVETVPGEGYGVSYTGKTGTIAAATQEAIVTNHKSSEIPTGISLDSLPYILILGFAGFGMSVLFFRKRRNANF